ncbi:hypothetical protein GIB67_030442 [Kingdonia uniflora]|uniref:Uncharacterized protein n=1 Tax=Kingdonia uniflora TaxID=39325 RepID=A0A7J7NE31_9MAGN|nr:hypothetical protein GIB67_030442 [Kingdonia uniflora]
MKASRSRYSRRLQLIQAYTQDEPNLSFRCKRSNSTSRLEIKQLNSLCSGRARPTSYRSIIVVSTMQFTYPKIKDMSQPTPLASDASPAIG